MTKEELMNIKHSQVITDPFPNHTQYSRDQITMRKPNFIKWFGKKEASKPREISIWEAYRMGYEKAYKEIEERL